MNINKEIEQLFSNHGFKATIKNDKVHVHINDKITVESRLTQRENGGGITSRLDVKVTLPNKQEIIECFGDVGSNVEEATLKNLENFALNSFHPITSCLIGDKEDTSITYEEWLIQGEKWDVFMGDYGIKETSEKLESIPENLYESMKEIILSQGFTNDYNWFSFYICQASNKIITTEFLINNEVNEQGQIKLSNLDWAYYEDFYSIRNFIMISRRIEKGKSSLLSKFFNRKFW